MADAKTENKRNGCVFLIGTCIILAFIGTAHNHFLEHDQEIALQKSHELANQKHLQHLAYQKAHPAEYAAEIAKERASAKRVELANINAKRAAQAQQQAQHAKEQRIANAQAAVEANEFHGNPDCVYLLRNSIHADSDESMWYIHGKVINSCDRSFGYAQVTFGYYDDSGNLVTSGAINVNNLEAGQTWSFSKPVYETNGQSYHYRVTGLSAF